MGANTSVHPGSRLEAVLTAGATQITVTEAGAGGLDYAQGEDVRIFNNTDILNVVDFELNDDDNNAAVSGETVTGLSAAPAGGAALASYALNVDKALTENTDYIVDYTGGQVRFLDSGNIAAGDILAFSGNYRRADKTRINLGAEIVDMEVSVRLVHKYAQGGRYMNVFIPRAIMQPENPGLNFDEGDWIGLEMIFDVLESEDPQYSASPFGWIDIDHSSETGQEEEGAKSYSVGTFDLYITPLSAVSAAARGFSTTEFKVGCVRVGGFEAEYEKLEHYCGTPRKKDAVVNLQQDMTITATVDNVTSKNLAMMFQGVRVEDTGSATYAPFVTLVTVPDISTPEGEAQWVKLPYVLLDPN